MLTANTQFTSIRVLIVESDPNFSAQLSALFQQISADLSPLDNAINAECISNNIRQAVTRAAHQKEPFAIAFVEVNPGNLESASEAIELLWRCDSDIGIVACSNDCDWQAIRSVVSRPEKITVIRKQFDGKQVHQLTASLFEQRNAMLQDRDRLFRISAQLHEAKDSLRLKNQHLELASRIARVGYGSMDLATQEIELSANACRILDLNDADCFSVQDLLSLIPRKDRIKFQLLLDEAIYRESDFEYKLCFNKNGNSRYVLTQVTCERDANSAKTSLFLVVRDVTHDETTLQAVQYASLHDSLTGLPNRAHFNSRLESAFRNARFAAKGNTLILLDLDRFKEVNDSFGHPTGDGLLKEFADRLKSCVRESDFVARLGGDEFAIIQSSSHLPEDAIGLVEQLYRACEMPYQIGEKSLRSRFSAGVALIPDDGHDVETILNNADVALYRAKQEGRGRYRFFDQEMVHQLRDRRLIAADLELALEREEFELNYQPIICTKTKQISGMEALVRWSHPERGLVRPDTFIEIAESTGSIVPLGRWVLRRACQDAVTWPEDVTLAVNVSAVQLQHSNFGDLVREILQESGLNPARLEMEITETVFLGHNDETLKTLNQIRELGVRVAMDDFGTGYSSLSYLREFRFDKIKLDRSFVSTNLEPESRAIISAVAGIGESLGLETCAEGVETEEQFQIIQLEGYSHVQGYYFGKPSPAVVIKRMFKGR